MKTKNQQAVYQFYEQLEQKDLSNWIGLWAEHGKISFPYAQHLVNTSLQGKEVVKNFGRTYCDLYARLSFTIKELFSDMGKVVTIIQTHHLIYNKNAFYSDANIGVFEFSDDGKITSYTEYFNPAIRGNSIHLLTQ